MKITYDGVGETLSIVIKEFAEKGRGYKNIKVPRHIRVIFLRFERIRNRVSAT